VEELVALYQPWRLGVSFGESEDTDVQDNSRRRCFLPKLTAVRLDWVSFQVMRRTQTSLLKELDVDPRVRASQMGHSVDVNENVYTITSLKRRRDGVNALEQAIWA
jgi:hypothetical protein